jgi:acetylglutamate kinase
MTRVIKVGGRPQADPMLPAILAAAATREPGALIVVHGGGDEVSTLQRVLGLRATFIDGRRVTSRDDIDVVRMALSGSANKRLVAALVERGVAAVGLSGEDASLICAVPIDPPRLGCVGKPVHIDVALLKHLITGGYVPVISPVSRDHHGELGTTLNVNGDDAASAIAAELDATELLLVSDTAGVVVRGEVAGRISPPEIDDLVAGGIVHGGMETKLRAAAGALDRGVSRVRISDVFGIADPARGTVLEHIRELV